MLSLLKDTKTCTSCQVDVAAFIDRAYNDIVQVLSSAANAYVPTYRKNFLKFWWNEELDALKADSINRTIFGRLQVNHDQVKFLRIDESVVLGIVRVLRNMRK